MGVGICVPDGVLAIAIGRAVAIGRAGLGGIATIAIGWPNRPSQVWFNLSRSTLIASSSTNSLIVAIISLFVH